MRRARGRKDKKALEGRTKVGTRKETKCQRNNASPQKWAGVKVDARRCINGSKDGRWAGIYLAEKG